MFVETLVEDMRLKCCGYSRVESQGESPARSRTARGQEVQESTGFCSMPVKKYELMMNDGHCCPRLEPCLQTRPLAPLLRYFLG